MYLVTLCVISVVDQSFGLSQPRDWRKVNAESHSYLEHLEVTKHLKIYCVYCVSGGE